MKWLLAIAITFAVVCWPLLVNYLDTAYFRGSVALYWAAWAAYPAIAGYVAWCVRGRL